MTRFLLHLSFPLIALFTITLAIIRAQPYDDYELRELLLPEGCPAPCFMDIRPGVTTVEEAVKILETSGWVGSINQARGHISWEWNGRQPIYFDTNEQGTLLVNNHNVVMVVFISTVKAIGFIHILLPVPTAYEIYLPVPDASGGIHAAIGIEYDTLVTSTDLMECPLKLYDLWRAPARISLYGNSEETLKYPVQWDNWNIRGSIKKVCQPG